MAQPPEGSNTEKLLKMFKKLQMLAGILFIIVIIATGFYILPAYVQVKQELADLKQTQSFLEKNASGYKYTNLKAFNSDKMFQADVDGIPVVIVDEGDKLHVYGNFDTVSK